MSAAEESRLPEGAEVQPDGSVSYPLKWPVRYSIGNDEKVLDRVVVRRKKYGDNLAIKKLDNPIDIGFVMLTRLTGLEPKIVEKLDDTDTDAIQDIILGFSPPGRTTGSGAAG